MDLDSEKEATMGLGGLTIEEMAVMENAVAAWEQFRELPSTSIEDLQTAAYSFNNIRLLLAHRVAQRSDPEYCR